MCCSGKFFFLFIFVIVFLHYNMQTESFPQVQELEKLIDILKHSHELLSQDLSIDPFSLMLNEMQENISLVSFSSRLATQVSHTIVEGIISSESIVFPPFLKLCSFLFLVV